MSLVTRGSRPGWTQRADPALWESLGRSKWVRFVDNEKEIILAQRGGRSSEPTYPSGSAAGFDFLAAETRGIKLFSQRPLKALISLHSYAADLRFCCLLLNAKIMTQHII